MPELSFRGKAWIEKIELSKGAPVPATAFLIGRIPGVEFSTARIFDTDSLRGTAQPDVDKEGDELRRRLYASYRPRSNPSLTQYTTGSRKPQQDQHEISGLDRKATFLEQLPLQRAIVQDLFPASSPHKKIPFVYAGQCHGSDLAFISSPTVETEQIDQVDGLITTDSEVILGITVADCAPVWILEKNGKAGALIHSGKKGTALEIVPKAIAFFNKELQIAPSELLLIIGPCIRPPCYEVDFAHTIREQAVAAGVKMIHDERICTACHLDRYYSYRREKGKTGHMLALLKLTSLSDI